MTETATRPASQASAPANGVDHRAEAAKAAVAGAAASVTFLLSIGPIARTIFLRCGDGFDAIGCAIVTFRLAVAAGLVLSAVAGAVVMRLLGARSPIAVALAGTLSAGALWPVTREFSSRPLSFVVMGSAYVLMYVAHSRLVVRREALRVLVTLVVAVVAFVLLQPVGEAVDHEQFRRKEQREAARLDFAVYELVAMPPRYRLSSADVYDIASRPPHYVIRYSYDPPDAPGRPLPFELKSFRVPAQFRPPNDCGWTHPSNRAPARGFPCGQIGAMPSGEPIWWAPKIGAANEDGYYVQIGDTLVTIETEDTMKPDEALTYLRSLRRMSPERLREVAG